MATSGTATFTYNRNQLISAALRKIGAFASGETPDAQTVTDASDTLNILVKAWNATGIHIWTETEATLFLQPSQVAYVLGSGSPDHCADGTSPAITTLFANAALGATSIVVLDASDIASGDNIGVTLNDGTIFWTTVNGAPSGSTAATVTLTNALTDSAPGGSGVYAYTSNIIRPLRVVAARRYNFLSALDTPMIAMSRLDYRDMPNKSTPGTVTQFFYDPRGGKNTQGVIYVWPAPTDTSNGVKFTWYRPMEDFTAAANTPDLPTEWIDALIWNLAVKLAPEYDVAPPRYQMLKSEAAESLDLAMGWDREPEAVYFGASMDYPQGR